MVAGQIQTVTEVSDDSPKEIRFILTTTFDAFNHNVIKYSGTEVRTRPEDKNNDLMIYLDRRTYFGNHWLKHEICHRFTSSAVRQD